MKKNLLILALMAALVWLFSTANRQSVTLQIKLIEAQCERRVAITIGPDAWPEGKVCEVTGRDIWTEVTVRAGPFSRMECDEILFPLSRDVTPSCRFE